MGVFSLCKEGDLKVLGSGRRESVVGAVAEGSVMGWRALGHVDAWRKARFGVLRVEIALFLLGDTMIYLKFQLNEIKSIIEIAFAGAWEADYSR